MLSFVLKSKVAVNVSIAIMDAFVAMRQYSQIRDLRGSIFFKKCQNFRDFRRLS